MNPERFWAKVDKSGECWLWTAFVNPGGYGQFNVDGKVVGAHRVAYEMVLGPIPDGRHIDHLCRVRHCVRPSHLEAVTQAENNRRGLAGQYFGAKQRAKTHCPKGHPYAGDNLFIAQGRRRCRECSRRVSRERHHRLKETA